MLIVCPSCASEYMIDPGRLGAEGRTVRCASCKDTWFVTPEPEQPGVPADAEEPAFAAGGRAEEDWGDAASPPPPEAADRADETRPRTKRSRPRASKRRTGEPSRLAERIRQAANPLMVAAVLVIVASAYWARAPIVRAFPATAALYASMGLAVNLRGLEFRTVRSELVGAGGDAILVVEGEIANISGRNAPVPPIEIGVRGAEGQMLYTWTNDPPREILGTSDTAHFRARLAAPPAEGRQVLVRFATGRDGATLASHTP